MDTDTDTYHKSNVVATNGVEEEPGQMAWRMVKTYMRAHPWRGTALLTCSVVIPVVQLLVPIAFGGLIRAISTSRVSSPAMSKASASASSINGALSLFTASLVMLQLTYAVFDLADVWVRPDFVLFVRSSVVSDVIDAVKSRYDVVDIGDIVSRSSKLPWSIDKIINAWVHTWIPMVVTGLLVLAYTCRHDLVLGICVIVLIVGYVYMCSTVLPLRCDNVSVRRDQAINTYVSKMDDTLRNLCSVYVENTKEYELSTMQRFSDVYVDLYRRTVQCFIPTHLVAFVGIVLLIAVYSSRTMALFRKGVISIAMFTTISLLVSIIVTMIASSTTTVKELTINYGILKESAAVLAQDSPSVSGPGGGISQADILRPPRHCLTGGTLSEDEDDAAHLNLNSGGRRGTSTSTSTSTTASTDAVGGVLVQNVSLRTISNYTRYFPAGKVSVLRGHNGCGKTTLFKIILGHMIPEQGTVTIWGQPYMTQLWRVGYVPQSPVLFDSTVYDNIVYGIVIGTEKPSKERVRDVIRAIELDKHIPDLDVRVGKGGGMLSGGQRQLIVFMRLLLNPRKDVWLLDEPTSALDEHARSVVMHVIRDQANRAGKTIIAILH